LPFSFSVNIASSAAVEPICTKYKFEPYFLPMIAIFLMLSTSEEEDGLQSDHVFKLDTESTCIIPAFSSLALLI
jgi:hypothetical protein